MKYCNMPICRESREMLLSRQVTWTGHVVRINEDRLPKAVLYGELWQAKRNVGRPHLLYMDYTKRHLHAADINKRHWEEMVHDRCAWQKRSRKKPKQKEQPMPKSNDNATMKVRSCLQIEHISSQSSHANTAEGNWRLVLANYPVKEVVRDNVERFAMLMSYSKPRRPPMTSLQLCI